MVLSFLHHHVLAPEGLRPRALPDRFVPTDRMPAEAVDMRGGPQAAAAAAQGLSADGRDDRRGCRDRPAVQHHRRLPRAADRAGPGQLPAALPPAPACARRRPPEARWPSARSGVRCAASSFLALTGAAARPLSAGDGAGHARHAGGALAVVPRHRLASWACAIIMAGRPFTDCPTLFVANHVSYLDVLALGAFARRHLHRQVRDRRLAAVRPAGQAHPDPVRPAPLAQRPDPAQRAGRPDAPGRELHPVRRGHQQQRAGACGRSRPACSAWPSPGSSTARSRSSR